ncbi:hypothetical protein AKJ66_01895 [candidate division MSBL1 archaeon SCGC-AAA259E22]|uniref:RecF/RecN/SMC N-terminal domain-containing protein n=1 Tax=candidate division MSBL1 archaeon SCGC-AAA259E22 TaxID=1698265 RepID=A0A133UH78_9EURY|nr:hypothetical protein AKJ66_01895 [candidate division MSBL1 archaeon SCGC-AAA259E22]
MKPDKAIIEPQSENKGKITDKRKSPLTIGGWGSWKMRSRRNGKPSGNSEGRRKRKRISRRISSSRASSGRGFRKPNRLLRRYSSRKYPRQLAGSSGSYEGGSQSLTWTKDYQIVVRDGEEEKAFHKLSGGEQVCAALTVRLAILQRLAPINFAFLDEPTENLDEARRQNLSSRLESIKALDQLCVISHDRVFEGIADRTISLEKKEGKNGGSGASPTKITSSTAGQQPRVERSEGSPRRGLRRLDYLRRAECIPGVFSTSRPA